MNYKILLTSIVIILTSCDSKKKDTNANLSNSSTENTVTLTNKQLKNVEIQTHVLEKRSISSILKVNGQIDVPPQNMVSISMPLGGYLKFTKLLPGMHFYKGEVIAVMEDQQYIELQQDYLITKSKLDFAEKEFVRQKELNQSQASSDKIFQLAETEYKNLKITLNSLAEKLKLININPKKLTENTISKSVNIYAPINGFVSKVNVNIGKYVNPTDVMFELINPLDIHLNLKVFEKDIAKLKIGQKLWAFTNNESDKKYLAEILLISKDLSSEHMGEVHCHFLTYNKILLPGMYMNAEIEITNNHALAIPEEAVINFEEKNYVFVSINKNTFEMKEVQTGNNKDGFIEISNNKDFVQKNIVAKGAYNLLMVLKNKSEE